MLIMLILNSDLVSIVVIFRPSDTHSDEYAEMPLDDAGMSIDDAT